MKSKIIILALIVILLTGCNFNLDSITNMFKKKATETTASAVTGTDGLVMKFLRMPSQLTPGMVLDVNLELENKGKADVKNGIIIMSGYNDKYMTFSKSREENINLEGVNQYTNQGGKSTATFKISKVTNPEQDYAANLVATSCYQYQTQLSPDVCINPKFVLSGIITKGECSQITFIPKDAGAPVSVTKVESWYAADLSSWQFKLFIQNKGKGKVRAEAAYAKDCVGPALSTDDIGKIKIIAALGGKQLECTTLQGPTMTNEFKLDDAGKAEIACKATIQKDTPSYTSPLTIILSYGYVDSISTPIKILKR